MSKQDTLTLVRTGDFAFKTVGDTHCGMAPPGGKQECRYIVRVRCTPQLDAKGYLFEQLDVDRYFQKITQVRSTCEVLTKRIADELVDMIVASNPSIEIKWIEVTLAAAPYAASMTFRFHP